MTNTENDLAQVKVAARKAASARRKDAHNEIRSTSGVANLLSVMTAHKGKVIAGYMPMRTEITPIPVMAAMSAHGPICVPVIEAAGLPLKFALWDPGTKMIEGAFGASIPEKSEYIEPEVVIAPLVAFDLKGGRLGYGGGFYDRTLEGLRAMRPTLAIGYAYAAQRADNLPLEATDQPLDAIVTDEGIHWF